MSSATGPQVFVQHDGANPYVAGKPIYIDLRPALWDVAKKTLPDKDIDPLIVKKTGGDPLRAMEMYAAEVETQAKLKYKFREVIYVMWIATVLFILLFVFDLFIIILISTQGRTEFLKITSDKEATWMTVWGIIGVLIVISGLWFIIRYFVKNFKAGERETWQKIRKSQKETKRARQGGLTEEVQLLD